MAAPPAAKFATICMVTSVGYGETPSAVTPWSPAISTMVLLRRTGRTSPWMADTRAATSSSLPRLRGGLVSESRRSHARSVADGSTAVSYTHLRAHETRHDLVCRLLL